MGQAQLAEGIVQRSVADVWHMARSEWSLAEVYFADEPDQCLCGQFPIIELCVLHNRQNGNEAIVGNVCVNKFLELPSDRIFIGLKRVRANINAALNEGATHYARTRGWINDWERDFLLNTRRKRNLSGAQEAKRAQINEKVLSHVARDTRPSQGAR